MTIIPTTLDLTPSTRILPILGEIQMELWQCLAELIDNPVDAFLTAMRSGAPLENPEVRISLPTSDTPTAQVTVRDNGPGMDLTTLNLAVRAGWTSNNPNDNLGLFGMGFNIATARLANRTRILSARAGDPEWIGVDIDFDAMRVQRHFDAPVIREPKSSPTEHGTKIEIMNLKPDKRASLVKATTISAIRKRLGRVYSSMLQSGGKPIEFKLYINNTTIRPFRHCVWSDERVVQTPRFGPVSAFMPLNFALAPRRFCSVHLEWLPAQADGCLVCGNADNVQARTRSITGWVAIQRYLSTTDFGIDILRNGRKIEVENRDFFAWQNDDGGMETEYPIDDPRRRGRIVGEIHFDHGKVNYTKDRFERSDPSWQEMFNLVHGAAPLRPEKTRDAGLEPNMSPLSKLYSTFRRETPKPIVAGSWQRLLVVKDNELATNWAVKFREGDAAFETDERWWNTVVQQDLDIQTGGGTPGPQPNPGSGPFPTPNPQPPGGAGPTPPPTPTPPPAPLRTEILALSREYIDDHSRRRFNVKAFSVKPSDSILGGDQVAWIIKTNANGDHEFYFNPDNQVYQSVTFTALDALLADLASKVADATRTSGSFVSSLTALRMRYATEYELNQQVLVGQANQVLGDIAASVSRNLDSESARTLYYELPREEQEAINSKMIANRIHDPLEYISNGRFLEFARRSYIVTFVAGHPELFFDGKYWDVRYSTLDWGGNSSATEIAKAEIIKTYCGWLDDAAWLSESEGGALIQSTRDRLLRAQMSLQLLGENLTATEEV